MKPRKKHLAIIGTLLLAVVLGWIMAVYFSGCANLSPIGKGFRATTYIAKARDMASKTLKAVCAPKMEACAKANPNSPPGYLECMEKNGCHKGLQLWGTILEPVIQASLQATIAGLEAARVAKTTHDWKKTLMPAGCGVYRAAVELKPLLGKTVGKILEMVSLIGLVCK